MTGVRLPVPSTGRDASWARAWGSTVPTKAPLSVVDAESLLWVGGDQYGDGFLVPLTETTLPWRGPHLSSYLATSSRPVASAIPEGQDFHL